MSRPARGKGRVPSANSMVIAAVMTGLFAGAVVFATRPSGPSLPSASAGELTTSSTSTTDVTSTTGTSTSVPGSPSTTEPATTVPPSSEPGTTVPNTSIPNTTVLTTTGSGAASGTTTTTVNVGLLPQTSTKPPSTNVDLKARLAPLFASIVAGSKSAAQPLFFPQNAYVSMKTGLLANPAADYTNRLVGFYNLDLTAAHQHVGKAPATLLSINAASAYATWIAPHVCENQIGYWHIPGVRFVYSQGGATKSFAVDSMISWRGTWYVVHLGPNPRPYNIGYVTSPSKGPGTPGPPGGC